MEFEFRKDFITGKATVQTEMDHEAFATWLEMEGQVKDWVEQLITQVEQLQSRTITEYTLTGSEFSLLLTHSEAQVTNHRLMELGDDETLDDDFSFYNAEIEGCCGLEDFKNLLASWLEFIG